MARPKKSGLDYFSMDVDIAHDIKVRKLLKHHGGARAIGVYTYILCQVYKNGYYVENNEDTIFIISEDLYETEEYINEIINACLEIGLFDRRTYEESHVLTSRGIQERYLEVQTHFRRSSTIDEYCLLDDDETFSQVSATKTNVSVTKTPVIATKTEVNEELCNNNEGFFSVSSEFAFQKRKERKIEREKKEEKSSSTSAPAREEKDFSEDFGKNDEGLDGEIKLLLGDSEWISNVAEYFGIDDSKIPAFLDRFRCSCVSHGMSSHQDIEDLKSHFTSWMRKQNNQNNSETSAYEQSKQRSARPTNERRRSASVPNGATQADFGGTF